MNTNDPHISTLCPQDRVALDMLVDAGFDLDALPADQRERGRKVLALAGLLEQWHVDDSGDLLAERTILAVDDARRTERVVQSRSAYAGSAPGMRLRDVAAIAAMIIVSVTLAMPMLSQHRARARQAACQSNLAAAGMGFSSYAAAYNGQLPSLKTRPGDPWWNINTFNPDGSTQSNSAHLFLLVRGGHVQPQQLTCSQVDGRLRITLQMRDWPDARVVSFSMQNMHASVKPKWDDGKSIAVLADKNPLFRVSGYNPDVPDDAPSANHDSLGGQNVLLNSGQVIWIQIPILPNGDNIWNTRSKPDQPYTGTETPADDTDSFLVW